MDAVKGAEIGGDEIKNGSFRSPANEYQVSYQNMKNGLILYQFTRKKSAEELAKEKKEKKKEEEKQKEDYQYKPRAAASETEFWKVLLAIAVAGGTIGEDIATGGLGIADDSASFWLAYKLITG